jgi:hypothetical protein
MHTIAAYDTSILFLDLNPETDGVFRTMHQAHGLCTANALYRKFKTNIPRNETARPRTQFLHPFINSHDQTASSIQQNRRTDHGNI